MKALGSPRKPIGTTEGLNEQLPSLEALLSSRQAELGLQMSCKLLKLKLVVAAAVFHTTRGEVAVGISEEPELGALNLGFAYQFLTAHRRLTRRIDS